MSNKKQLQEATKSMIRWLSHPNEFGHEPYEIACTHEFDSNEEHFYVFKFQKAIEGKWFIGVCGGYESEESLEHNGIVFSHFQEYSEDTAIHHAMEIIKAIRDYWRKENENWTNEN